jgi:Ran-binding protein 1
MGNVRLLSHQATGKTRLVMYSDENPRVRADHPGMLRPREAAKIILMDTPVSVDMRLQHNGGSDSDRSWVWQVTADYSGDSPTRGTFAVRFGSVEGELVDAALYRRLNSCRCQ